MWTWHDSKVIRIEEQSPTTKSFWLEVPGEDKIEFKPGQFVTMDLPIHEKRLKRWRSYSMANAPEGNNILEFSIVNLEGGPASKYFFENVKIGTEIRFKGPSGVFTLPDQIDSKLVFVCTGTGVAPFRSMIRYFDLIGSDFPEIHLIFGTRLEENILYREEFEDLAARQKKFEYSVCLSRESKWDGYKGYVHQVYQSRYKPEDNITFYLCGWKNMIDEARARLDKLGFEKSRVKFELYG